MLKFQKVYIETITINIELPFCLYLLINNRYVLYCNRRKKLSYVDRQRLLENNIHTVYVSTDEYLVYNKYVEERLESLLSSDIDIKIKGKVLYSASINYINETFEVIEEISDLSRSKNLVHNIITYISSAKDIQDLLNPVISHDFSTYTHSVQTTVLILVLARHMFTTQKEEFFLDIGSGGLLHDIGKNLIDTELLNKPGSLTKAEFSEVKKHPKYGQELLLDQNINNKIIHQMVLQHHEKFDGSGYPYGLSGTNISETGRLVSVADVYVSLISDRPYRAKLTSNEALTIMETEMAGSFDLRYLDLLKNIILYGLH